MTLNRFGIQENVAHSPTLPASFYQSPATFDEVKEKIFAKSWMYVSDSSVLTHPIRQYPLTLLPGVFDEPLVLTRDTEDQQHCFSNVCTHRGKLVVEKPQGGRKLVCGYHGRCFDLLGKFKSTPGFEGAADFPSPADHLHELPLQQWINMFFTSLDPSFPFEKAIQPIVERMQGMPIDEMIYRPEFSTTYHVKANWALYIDNFLEGFHVPFVHPGLNSALDLANYEYELFPYCNLQLAIAKDDEPHFDLPTSSPDYGRKVFAYYFWLFPNLMFNFYPWGLSLNIIEPLSHTETKVSFRNYVYQDSDYNWEGNLIHITELEDEAVVESVQKGIQSRFYKRGRFSPSMERCVHHFHRLVNDFMG